MTDKTERLAGQCLCGGVRFTAAPPRHEMTVCHCGMCRRWAGGIFTYVRCFGTMEIADESNLGIYKSSAWAERGFCKRCGSTLFWRSPKTQSVAVSAQAFENPEMFTFVREIYIDEKPSNYAFANKTVQETAAELEAKSPIARPSKLAAAAKTS